MRGKHVFILYILSSSLKEEINACVRVNIDDGQLRDGQSRDMSRSYPRLIFFRRGNYGTPFLTIRRRIAWHRFHISKVHYLFVFNSQTNKSVTNWVVLILIEQNIIFKTRNQDFTPSKIEYVITLLKWLVRLILFLFLVVYRSTFKVVLTIFRILFCKKPFKPVPFLPHHFNCLVITPLTVKKALFKNAWVLKERSVPHLIIPKVVFRIFLVTDRSQ